MKKAVYWFLLFTILLMLADACKHEAEELVITEPELSIVLRWHKGYSAETAADAETALKWTLSYLGAALPAGSFKQTVSWVSLYEMQLNLAQAGFSENAQGYLKQLLHLLRTSDEYQQKKSIDLGRFIALTIGSSNHYYAITGAAGLFSLYPPQYIYDTTKVALTKSTVSKVHRLIEVPYAGAGALGLSYIAHEGTGRLDSNTFHIEEHEVIDVMANGQLRVAMYESATGRLRAYADQMVSDGGKPAKCLWCHELYFNPSFAGTMDDVPGYYTVNNFQQKVTATMTVLNQYRTTLNGDIDFNAKQEHAQMELSYISFMEPSADRLALEWGVSKAEVETIMSGFTTHIYPEFPFLGQLYYRYEAELKAPFKGVQVPTSIREPSTYEPNLLR